MPDIDTYIGLMHTLFALEDLYGLTVESENSTVSLYVNPYKGNDAARLNEMLVAWAQQAKKLRRGEISPEGYDRWRRYYPEYDTAQGWAKAPAKELSDVLVEFRKDKLKNR